MPSHFLRGTETPPIRSLLSIELTVTEPRPLAASGSAANRRTAAIALWAAVVSLTPVPAAAETQRRTPNDAASQAGLSLLRSLRTDFDGDGKEEVIAACEDDAGIRVCIFGENEKGSVLRATLPPARGTQLHRIEAKDFHSGRPGADIWLEVYDETPDEKVKRVRIYAGVPEPHEIFESSIYRAKRKSERGVWEQPDVIRYGDAQPGWYFQDNDNDGILEIFVRRRPQLLEVPRAGVGQTRLLTGVREAMFRWEPRPDGGRYVPSGKEHFRDFLPAYPLRAATGSSAFVPAQQLNEMKAAALTRAVQTLGQSAPEAAAPAREAAATKEDEDSMLDFSPFYRNAIDGDLDTAWIENDTKGPGLGEWLEVQLEAPQPIRMVRVVGGCTRDAKTYRVHNRPERYELRLDDGAPITVDEADPQRAAQGLEGMMLVPVQNRKYAQQALIFFDGKTEAQRVRLSLVDSKRGGRANHTCISEISVH